ncbi:MAG TPA: cytochrome c-type biogenesis CcmF C-terminal domain-containing protein [Solirubrobacteraceae bacterium]|jgi:cytochrome c-type biogenesis protein CcmF|nr:cytochrome c-type biogenesis CcmF C-terminal domain-containing protein [Solirubrobacteraceae bacterium]
MAFAGHLVMVVALVVCLYGIGAALYGARHGRRDWVDSGRRSVYCLAVVLTLGMVILEVAFVRNDFSYTAVANTSSTTTPLLYRVAAMWSSQEGSLLLWVWLLSIWSSAAIYLTRNRLRDVVPYATSVLLGFGAFFTTLLVFLDSPFGQMSSVPTDGAGLDPLLRNPSMLIHPPMLYSGYTFFSIPFAFAVGALIVRRVDADWIRITRRFALASWMFLGIGILLGARWSYYELGWGGYWGWDPVENAALMPWLISTAFLHSVMIQEKRGMLKIWNASLVLGASTLAIVGTFLVRSGVLDSIHAFTGGGLGVPFVALIATMVAGSVYLVVTRREVLRSEHSLDSLFSREAAFLLNNIILVGLCFVIFWGTFFPLISQAVTGTSAKVGPPWFDRYTVPLALILVLLSGIGPVIAWRRATLANARRNFALPVAAAGAMAIAAYTVVPIGSSVPTVILFCCAMFVLASIGQEFWRGTRARRAMSSEAPPLALLSMVRRNRRRYGGYIVHTGIAVLFIGVAASSTFQHEQELSLQVGQSTHVGAYTMRYVKATSHVVNDPSHTGATLTLGAVLRVTRDGKYVATLRPAADYYPASSILSGQVVADLISGDAVQQVALKSSLRRDLWAAIKPLGTTLPSTGVQVPEESLVALGDTTILPSTPQEKQLEAAYIELGAIADAYRRNPPPASFTLISSPLVMWIWLGGLIVLLGGLTAIWPPPAARRGRIRARYFARVAQELGRA